MGSGMVCDTLIGPANEDSTFIKVSLIIWSNFIAQNHVPFANRLTSYYMNMNEPSFSAPQSLPLYEYWQESFCVEGETALSAAWNFEVGWEITRESPLRGVKGSFVTEKAQKHPQIMALRKILTIVRGIHLVPS